MKAKNETSEEASDKKPDQIAPVASNRSRMRTVSIIVRRIVAILFWSYAILKLFVFDIDKYLILRIFPNASWVLTFKFVLVVILLALLLVLFKRAWLFMNVSYVILFPLILIFWHLPLLIISQRSWNLAFAALNGFLILVRSFKFAFICFALYLLASLGVFYAPPNWLLLISIILLFGIVSILYVRLFISIFKTAGIFEFYRRVFAWIRTNTKDLYMIGEDVKQLPLESRSEQQVTKYSTALQWAVMFNRMALYLAKKLRDYRSRKINYIGYIASVVLLILFTVISFALINQGLFRYDATFFAANHPSFFTFFYYAFNVYIFSSIPDISPLVWQAQLSVVIESILAFLVVVILFSIYINLKSNRYDTELSRGISDLEAEGGAMEEIIQAEYNLGIEDALQQLQQLQAGTVKFLLSLTAEITRGP